MTSRGIDNFHDIRVASFSHTARAELGSVNSVLASRDGTVWIEVRVWMFSGVGKITSISRGKVYQAGGHIVARDRPVGFGSRRPRNVGV